jgi:hypothetical protein
VCLIYEDMFLWLVVLIRIIKNTYKILGVVRIADIDPCVNQVLSNDKMNSEETISLRELSQILAASKISSF